MYSRKPVVAESMAHMIAQKSGGERFWSQLLKYPDTGTYS
jgi:hypothetical protein